MLRRLLLGQPRREEIKDSKKEICEDVKRNPNWSITKSTTKNTKEKSEEKDDLFERDSETDSSDTEDSDTGTLDNSSRTASYEDCSGDVLEWKGFAVVKDARIAQNSKSNGSTTEIAMKHQSQCGKAKQNPFAHAFEIEDSEDSYIHGDAVQMNYSNNNNDDNDNNMDGHKDNNTTRNNKNNINERDNTTDQSTNKEFENNSENTNNQTNDKESDQTNNSKTTTNTSNKSTPSFNADKPKFTSNPTTNTNNTINNTKQINSSKQLDKTKPAKFGQSKVTSAEQQSVSLNSQTNRKPLNPRGNGISRHYSIRENQQKSNVKGPSINKTNTGWKTTSASVDTKWHQGIGKDKTGLKAQKINNKQKQGSPLHVSVKDLEKILGVNVTELQEVIKKYKSEEPSVTGDCLGKNDATDSTSGSSEIFSDNLVGETKSQDGCKKDEIKKTNNETADNKDEISSDSGVSEPDANSTESQPHYVTLKAIVKRKEYLEGQIRKLEDRVVVMEDHKKDIQFIHDLFDLHSDGLSKVERSNGGIASIPNLKRILECQLHELDEEEFKAKLKSLEDLGIPNFSEVNARIEKLRKRIRHTLDDERKCRSKGVQKLKFEIGKVQGMCEAILDLVYTAK